MKEIYGDLWEHLGKTVVVITTNGVVKKDGACVMGRGCAKEALQQFSNVGIQYSIGRHIQKNGNIPCVIKVPPGTVVTFPVKHNWWEKADISLIAKSASILKQLADENGWERIVLPRPGCGNGHLDWKDVKPILEKHLDDRFEVITWKAAEAKKPGELR